MQEKLQSLSEDPDGSCPSELQNDRTPISADASENGEKKETENGQTLNKGGHSESSKEKLHEILNRELSIFCEKMSSTRTGDVSKEQETNERHEVAEGYRDSTKPDDDIETDGKESEVCTSNANHKFMSGDETFVEEIDNLKRKLTGDLITLISSNEGKILK